ncbi:MAG: hypothetical protein LBC12_03425 [Nitrososphaerota archaeon]|nr:hypothetical protein [Nitrososphaerota archaeon]
MRSYVHDKAQCWLWHAIDHCSGEVLAYTFGHVSIVFWRSYFCC